MIKIPYLKRLLYILASTISIATQANAVQATKCVYSAANITDSTQPNTYTIKPIAGWYKLDTTINGKRYTALLSPLTSPTDNFKENVNVVHEGINNTYTLASYHSMSTSNCKQYLTLFKVVSSTPTMVHKYKAIKTIYVHTMQGVELKVTSYTILYKGVAYTITCTAMPAMHQLYSIDFSKVVQSFRIIE